MKTRYLLLLPFLAAAPLSAFAQSDGPAPSSSADPAPATRLSPYAMRLQHDLEQLDRKVRKRDTLLIERYSLVRQGCTYYVPAVITLDHPYVDGELSKYGVRVQSSFGSQVTALVSTRKYLKFIASGLAREIEVSAPLHTTTTPATTLRLN